MEKAKDLVYLFGFCLIVFAVIGLAVSMIVACLADIFTAIAYGKWAIWGAGVGAVVGAIIGILVARIDDGSEGGANDVEGYCD